jgi:hypothetical protein
MADRILGLTTDTFYALVLLLLLIILGIVTFHYYIYLSGGNGIRFGTGLGVSILPGYGYRTGAQQQ